MRHACSDYKPVKIVRVSEQTAAAELERKANHKEADLVAKEAGISDQQYRRTI